MSIRTSLPVEPRPGRAPESDQDRYGAAARTFHWTIALLIAGMYLTDWMRGAAMRASPERAWWLATHETLGILVLSLTLGRLAWRLGHPAPPIHGTPLIRRAAQAGHILLYLATLGLPLPGIGRAMAGGGKVTFFGLVFPSLTGNNDMLAAVSRFIHGGLMMNLLLLLIAGHVLAALWHEFILKDGTLRRML